MCGEKKKKNTEDQLYILHKSKKPILLLLDGTHTFITDIIKKNSFNCIVKAHVLF